jgi:hypothetical protein|tara:strand:- start:618 stop:833 length:216 start_codon:yes stop_codon:yes gene_type:complete
MGALSGVKLGNHPVGGLDSNVLLQVEIHPWWVLFHLIGALSQKIDHLALGVSPGVGPAGAPDPDFLSCELG